jgi:hypothetical protein
MIEAVVVEGKHEWYIKRGLFRMDVLGIKP